MLFSGCSSPNGTVGTQYRDYASAVGSPYPQETAVAQARFDRYMAHLSTQGRERLAGYEYVAVEATTVPLANVGSVLKDLAKKGQMSGDLANDPYNVSAARVPFIMVFSTKTMRPATDEGYIAMSTPQKGKPGLFSGYNALYIGKGR